MGSIIQKIVPGFIVNFYHQMWPALGAVIYRFPAKKVKVIGITGTNGKTTVVHLATEILEAAGYKVASISSLRFKIGEKEWKNELKMTMPGRMKIQKFLRQAADARCQYVVMEVTSEGIKQYRHKFIDFDVAVFTNLTPEHVESHGGFENYKRAKGELFKSAKTAIINLDDENAEYFSALCKGKKYGYSVESGSIDIATPLPGKFNLYNALAAAYVGLSQGVDMKVIKETLGKAKGIPGRMETVIKEPFPVIVDYAHTPDALEKVYKTVKGRHKLVCVLGAAGGGRDKWKRPQMGKIAARYCDEIILTNEDPYNEDPSRILAEIKSGISSPISKLYEILDRRKAIKKALRIAKRGDIVVVTGKGAEPWLMTGEGRVAWDDREIVRAVYREIFG